MLQKWKGLWSLLKGIHQLHFNCTSTAYFTLHSLISIKTQLPAGRDHGYLVDLSFLEHIRVSWTSQVWSKTETHWTAVVAFKLVILVYIPDPSFSRDAIWGELHHVSVSSSVRESTSTPSSWFVGRHKQNIFKCLFLFYYMKANWAQHLLPRN